MTPSTSFPVRRMSGGNVQKVLVGREIAQAPAVLMTAYAVRGLDINTSYTIYNLLTEQKMKGVAVMYVGEDLDVLLELCDRIVVLCGGQVSGVVDARTADKRQIGALMTRMERRQRQMNKKQSLFHIAKRDSPALVQELRPSGAAAILLALVVCAVVTMLLTGENPVSIYATIFKGAFGTARKSWVTFQNLAVLLGISLAVTPAFKMRFWNIGAEGQVLIGCLATAACMICLADKLPNAVLILVMLMAAALAAGALWGFLPAFFKAKWNTNETLFTLMMNYIATQLAAFFIIVWEVPKGAGKIGIINQGTEAGWLPVIGGQKYLLSDPCGGGAHRVHVHLPQLQQARL